MSKTYTTDLKNYTKLAQYIVKNDIGEGIEKGFDKGMNELRVETEDKMRWNILRLKCVETGDLLNHTHSFRTLRGFIVRNNSDHAQYVEFGTGIKGLRNPHPHAQSDGWAYDVNNHGDNGWIYKGKDGKRHWTAGMKSRRFGYSTWNWCKRNITKILSTFIEKELR